MTKKQVLIKQGQAPGDIVVLTAAVRDLVRQHSDKFAVNVETTAMQIWDNNPYLDRTITKENADIVINAEYNLVNKINGYPWHFLHGFRRDLENQLGVTIEAGPFKGDIHLHTIETKVFPSQIQEITGSDLMYWLICPGVKMDYTNKAWEFNRYQQVVDHYKGKILFVQVGERGHGHPGLNGVIDMRGKTDTRQLIRMVYHSSGIICGVTFLMHLSAAVPVRDDRSLKTRPTIVIAGGREPPQWEAYPWHQFLHTCGALPCCDIGGCWKSRVQPLSVDPKHNEKLCLHPVTTDSGQVIPQCMDMIKSNDVIRCLDIYDCGMRTAGMSFSNGGFDLNRFHVENPAYDNMQNGQTINSCSWINNVFPQTGDMKK